MRCKTNNISMAWQCTLSRPRLQLSASGLTETCLAAACLLANTPADRDRETETPDSANTARTHDAPADLLVLARHTHGTLADGRPPQCPRVHPPPPLESHARGPPLSSLLPSPAHTPPLDSPRRAGFSPPPLLAPAAQRLSSDHRALNCQTHRRPPSEWKNNTAEGQHARALQQKPCRLPILVGQY